MVPLRSILVESFESFFETLSQKKGKNADRAPAQTLGTSGLGTGPINALTNPAGDRGPAGVPGQRGGGRVGSCPGGAGRIQFRPQGLRPAVTPQAPTGPSPEPQGRSPHRPSACAWGVPSGFLQDAPLLREESGGALKGSLSQALPERSAALPVLVTLASLGSAEETLPTNPSQTPRATGRARAARRGPEAPKPAPRPADTCELTDSPAPRGKGLRRGSRHRDPGPVP